MIYAGAPLLLSGSGGGGDQGQTGEGQAGVGQAGVHQTAVQETVPVRQTVQGQRVQGGHTVTGGVGQGRGMGHQGGGGGNHVHRGGLLLGDQTAGGRHVGGVLQRSGRGHSQEQGSVNQAHVETCVY